MAETHSPRDEKEPRRPKRPYHPPRLVRYGDAATLTQNRFAGGKSDKGGGFKNRTN